ncbi:sulfurtransferase [Mesorhizobium sp. BAC0120]|uniref:sulfurtransferase n=1 Tax=Mesorhizobium sp. BAC0120 TaxID=3090670 RepID=UPI00298CBA29|nr:sulfurtransferase [Mesorhizobium sp. BAC0120]MDW6023233.1 sulfurtransferase [Mesorhizobium sp. BAC0120]
MSDWLIETHELAALLAAEPNADRVVLDCSWYVPDAGRDAREDFRAGHIPGARFVDLSDISDPDSPYVNMLPSAEIFARVIGGLGISGETEVIVYDAGYVSARIWWMFRTFGHDQVKILNGGWRKWLAERRPVETGDFATSTPRNFPARLIEGRVARIEDVRQVIGHGGASIIDARTAARFDGHEASGYPGVASGYMPGSINTPWALFYEPAPSHRFVSPERAKQIFAERGVDLSGAVITTCGSGVTASILGFMLEAIGHSDWRLYDGSWHEWGQQPDTPKLTKPL